MENIELHILVILSLLLVTFVTTAAPARYHKDFIDNENYEMQEPFSSSPLVIYPSLEASGVDS